MDFDSYYRIMFSSLGKIFPNLPRQTEGADARLDIRRHDPDQERSKRKKADEHDGGYEEAGDSATVTIPALRVFLENFLRSQLTADGGRADGPVEATEPQPQPHDNPAASGRAAMAASAYQAASRKSHDAPAPPPPSHETPAPQLRPDEVRTIHQLLEDLKILAEENVEYLRIERSDSFLGSLVAAIKKARGL